jgi:hypothetical protein
MDASGAGVGVEENALVRHAGRRTYSLDITHNSSSRTIVTTMTSSSAIYLSSPRVMCDV